jgi:GNAT superfamily N-acetyltransferase
MSAEAPPALDRLEFHMVEGDRWRDLVTLFEGRGGPKHCWCMVWREAGPNRGRLTRDDRKELLHRQLLAGEPIGLLAYLEGEPVAWCSVAPRETYREKALHGADAPGDVVWSIVCFFAQRRVRGLGVAHALLDAAVREATLRGATVIEAYPVDPDAPSYRYMGFTSMFRAAGFRELGRAGTRRHVMQLEVAASRRRSR